MRRVCWSWASEVIFFQDLEEDIYDWIHTGNVGKLEELVLAGYADLLLGRNHEVEDAESIGFLEVLPQYQVVCKGSLLSNFVWQKRNLRKNFESNTQMFS